MSKSLTNFDHDDWPSALVDSTQMTFHSCRTMLIYALEVSPSPLSQAIPTIRTNSVNIPWISYIFLDMSGRRFFFYYLTVHIQSDCCPVNSRYKITYCLQDNIRNISQNKSMTNLSFSKGHWNILFTDYFVEFNEIILILLRKLEYIKNNYIKVYLYFIENNRQRYPYILHISFIL